MRKLQHKITCVYQEPLIILLKPVLNKKYPCYKSKAPNTNCELYIFYWRACFNRIYKKTNRVQNQLPITSGTALIYFKILKVRNPTPQKHYQTLNPNQKWLIMEVLNVRINTINLHNNIDLKNPPNQDYISLCYISSTIVLHTIPICQKKL